MVNCRKCGCPKRYHDPGDGELVAACCYGAQDGLKCIVNIYHGFEEQDYMLTGHRCRPVARMVMSEGRDWWLGELTEPFGEWSETHCLHITTPLKSVVLGTNLADWQQLTVLARIVTGPVNEHWIERMEALMRKRAQR